MNVRPLITVGGMNRGMVELARTRSIISRSVGQSAFVQATVSPVSQSKPSMCTSASLAANVSKSNAITASVPASSSATPSYRYGALK